MNAYLTGFSFVAIIALILISFYQYKFSIISYFDYLFNILI